MTQNVYHIQTENPLLKDGDSNAMGKAAIKSGIIPNMARFQLGDGEFWLSIPPIQGNEWIQVALWGLGIFS